MVLEVKKMTPTSTLDSVPDLIDLPWTWAGQNLQL